MVKARASSEAIPRAAGSVSTLYWWYQCTLQPYLAKTLAVSMAVMSAAIVWSESTLRFDWINISPLAAVRRSLMAHARRWHIINPSRVDDSSRFACRLCIRTAKVQPRFSCSSQVRKSSLQQCCRQADAPAMLLQLTSYYCCKQCLSPIHAAAHTLRFSSLATFLSTEWCAPPYVQYAQWSLEASRMPW